VTVAHSIARTLLVGGLLVGTACSCSSGSVRPFAVGKADVAKQITDKMTDANGTKPESVTCPQDLDADVGAQVNCVMHVKKKTYGVNVTVTGVDGNGVKFNMVETVDKSVIAHEISDKFAQQSGSRPDSVTCPEDLKGVEGATLRCQLTRAGTTVPVDLRVLSIYGGIVRFDIQIGDQPRPSG
jgi:Domain of unknown function (DUF4333)